MERKIVFLDIDGTLTEPGKNIPPQSALTAIEKARENGHLIYLCTGRNYGMMKPLLDYEFDGYISSSGGYVVCGDEILFDCPMTEKQRVETLDVLKRNGIFRTVECKDGSYTDPEFKEFLRNNAEASGNSEFLRWREQIEASLNIRSMDEYAGQPIYKMVLMIDEESKMEEPMELFQNDFKFCIQEKNDQGFINCELLSKQFDKGEAIKKVCAHLGISLKDTFAFGDSMNDLEMMNVAAFSVCMENGNRELKIVADDICPAVLDDGLYKAFEKYGLI